MDVDRMEVGRELDALIWLALNGKTGEMINQDILGCRHIDGDIQPHAGYPVGHISPPNYSIYIAMDWIERQVEQYREGIADIHRWDYLEVQGKDNDLNSFLEWLKKDM